MSLRHRVAWVVALLFTFAFANAMAQQEPTVDQIYQTARSGQTAQARQMIDQVVRNHPDSAKAHYVRAEITARQGDRGVAQQELARAEQLAPGLPFAKPEAVSALRAELQGQPSTTRTMGGPPAEAPARRGASGLPWGMLLGGALLLIVVAMMMRRRSIAGGASTWRASPTAGPVVSSGGPPADGMQPGAYPPGSYPQGGYPPGSYPPGYGPAGGGMGSTLGRGLATGLAVGAGAVAAQEIGRHILHGRDGSLPPEDPSQGVGGVSGDLSRFDGNADMGGQDFGLQDGGGSWDSGNSGGDSGAGDVGGGDWDNS